jgi:hypothetical protein
MSLLYTVRTGWEAERLAHYLLSRFSFVAQPTTIADDVGSDFYCTIFDIPNSTPPMVEPRTSFAIQVKSNGNMVEAHNKIQFLFNLEIPFFLGVVDLSASALKVYSAERFPLMTAVFGIPNRLWLQPVDEDDPQHPWSGTDADSGVTLNCYHVCTFTASEGRTEIRPKVERLLKLCRRAVNNIGTRRVEEHIYQVDDEGKSFQIVAGCGSVNYFRDNIYKRLAEAFYNFRYMLTRDPALFNLAEFRIYESFHLAVVAAQPRDSLQLAHERYLEVKAIVEQRYSRSANGTAYNLVEHRHRFSVWAAARAAQRGLKGAKVDVLRDALEESGAMAFAKANDGPIGPIDQAAFDQLHRAWCRSIIAYLASHGVPAAFGRAAKLIAIYLKSMIILNNAGTNRTRVIHPPIDGILLRNICKATELQSRHKATWGKLSWTTLSEDEYYRLIDQLRMCIAHGEPFWTLERFWTVTDDQE